MKNQLKAGVILSYISTAVSIVIQLVYMPVMLRLLGQSEYGLYSLVSGVVSYLGLFSLGFLFYFHDFGCLFLFCSLVFSRKIFCFCHKKSYRPIGLNFSFVRNPSVSH